MQQLLHRGAALAQHQDEQMCDASWDDLRLFLVCARHKSFRNSAEVLGLTSTTLMRRIDRLEERICCKLFLRGQGGVTLSEAGRSMMADVTEMERHAFSVLRRAAHSLQKGTGTVRVSVTEWLGNFWILPRLIDFQEAHRNITVDLQCTLEHADVARLETDIAIQLEPPTNPDLIVTKIGRVHAYPFVSKAYRKRHGVPATPAEIKNHRIIRQDAPQLNDTTASRAAGLCMLGGIVAMKTNSTIGVLGAVERGAGIGLLPTATIATGSPLLGVDIGVSYQWDLWLTYHKEFRNSDPHKMVIEWLKKIFNPKIHPCFRDEFIHPNDLVPLMSAPTTGFVATGYVDARLA